MKLLKGASFYFFLQITTFFINVYGQCPWKDGALPTVENGYRSNVDNLTLYKNALAYGFYDISCEAGYVLDLTIGGRITCLPSGSWSQPLPQCKSTGRCSIPTLFTYLQTTTGIRVDRSLSFIYTNGVNDDQALGGSNITIQCVKGYANIGGSLTIICTETNSWTTFPNCLYNSTTTTTTTTTTTATPIPRCPVTDDTWTFTNGYVSNTSGVTVYNDDTAIGFVVVSCSSGYVIDSVSGGLLTCNKGVWSARPYCSKTARCSLPTIKTFINDPVAAKCMKIISQRLTINPDETDQILIGSYILFACKDGYTDINNNLNVTCNVDGQWSTFPSCTPLSTTTFPTNAGNNAVVTSTISNSGRKK